MINNKKIKNKIVNFIVDTVVANVVGVITVVPYCYYISGMDVPNVWKVFWSFWTVGWLTAASVVWALKQFRYRYPYRSDGVVPETV